MEHYPRLVRLAYLVLPPSTARHRRVLTAHSLVQRALPRGRGSGSPAAARRSSFPGQRHSAAYRPPGDRRRGGADRAAGEAYAHLSTRVLRAALAAERPRRIGPWKLRPLPSRPGLFPRVFGLRLFPRSGGADELALDQALSKVSGAARAAYALRGLEGMTDAEVRRMLTAAGVRDPLAALSDADAVRGPSGNRARALLSSAEFDPCSLQARPTDLMRRRQHGRAALAAVVAVVICGGLLGLPDGSWGPDGAAAPSYARNPSAEKALDPGELIRVSPGAWKRSSRADFSSWPARGDLTGDRGLLRRALAVWARPGRQVTVSATRGTPAGPPAGPPHLLYAGRVDGASVVVLHDGLRVARYAEPEGADEGGAVLDLARTDGAEAASAAALVVSRSDTNVRYLTAPWVARAAEADLLRPEDRGRALKREDDGVTAAVTGPDARSRACTRWPGLLLTDRASGGADNPAPRLYTDLGELTAVRLTGGSPGGQPSEATGSAARAALARTVCGLRTMVGGGVRSVNSWQFARQLLPDGGGVASWSCTRGETWRGQGAAVVGNFLPPSEEPDEPALVSARAAGTTACGPRQPHAVSGVSWKSSTGDRYVLAAGSRHVAGISAAGRGGPYGSSPGRTLTLPAEKGSRAKISARLADGRTLHEPH